MCWHLRGLFSPDGAAWPLLPRVYRVELPLAGAAASGILSDCSWGDLGLSVASGGTIPRGQRGVRSGGQGEGIGAEFYGAPQGGSVVETRALDEETRRLPTRSVTMMNV